MRIQFLLRTDGLHILLPFEFVLEQVEINIPTANGDSENTVFQVLKLPLSWTQELNYLLNKDLGDVVSRAKEKRIAELKRELALLESGKIP